MEFILEALFELVFELIGEGSLSIGTNKKYSRWIRYSMLFLASIFYIGVIAFMVFLGFAVLEDGLWRAIFFWGFPLFFVVASILILREDYKKRKNKERKTKEKILFTEEEIELLKAYQAANGSPRKNGD